MQKTIKKNVLSETCATLQNFIDRKMPSGNVTYPLNSVFFTPLPLVFGLCRVGGLFSGLCSAGGSLVEDGGECGLRIAGSAVVVFIPEGPGSRPAARHEVHVRLTLLPENVQ